MIEPFVRVCSLLPGLSLEAWASDDKQPLAKDQHRGKGTWL